jgi:plastocyanin
MEMHRMTEGEEMKKKKMLTWRILIIINDDDDDNSFSVIIPENAAWNVSIDQRFDPSNLTILVGTGVTWINEDKSQHTVTSGNLTNQGRDRIYDGRLYSGILGSEDSFF